MKATEATYTALARVAAGNGDPARAFALVDECKAAGLDTKLRTFSPALVAFCEAGQLDHAFKVRARPGRPAECCDVCWGANRTIRVWHGATENRP